MIKFDRRIQWNCWGLGVAVYFSEGNSSLTLMIGPIYLEIYEREVIKDD